MALNLFGIERSVADPGGGLRGLKTPPRPDQL